MKKLAAFLLLFGAALLLLRFLEGGDEPEAPPSDDGGQQAPPDVDDGGTDPDGGAADPVVQRPPGLALSGEQNLSLFEADQDDPDRRWLVLRMKALDSRTDALDLGTQGAPSLRDVLLDATADLFEVGKPDDPQARIDAKTMVFPRKRDERAEDELLVQPDWVRRAELSDLDVRLLSGAPFVPLDFDATSAVLDARDGTARTLFAPGRILVESDDLDATGDDLTVELDASAFTFARDTEVTFQRETGDVVRLSSEGALVVGQRPDLDPAAGDVVQIEARGGATLRLEGEDGSTLTARTIRARGREREGVAGDFVLTEFDAEGDVVWTSGGAEARGERAELEFGPDGELRSWKLESDPSLRIPIADLQEVDPAPDLESVGTVLIRGEGPLTGRSDDVRGFVMNGPALAEIFGPEAEALAHTTLRAGGSLAGTIDEQGGQAELRATGGVLLESDDGTLEAQALTAALEEAEADAEDQLEITTIGGAKLTARTSEDDATLSFVSGRRLRATRTGSAWTIHEAGDVNVSLEPDDPDATDGVFRAQAGRVTRFDPTTRELVADEGVVVQSAQGVGRGRSIEVRGEDRIELFGTPEEPATFEGTEGTAQAQYILRAGDRTEARGAVLTRFVRVGGPRFPTQDYEIRCDELDAQQSRVDRPDGGQERVFSLEARGSVDGRVGFGDESSTIRCEVLTGTRLERWERDADDALRPVDARTELRASGSIEGQLTLRGSQVDLTCATLDLTRAESLEPLGPEEEEEDSPFTVLAEARGGVEFDLLTVSTAQPIRLKGTGESLTIDETLTGSLAPGPGERVELRGSLPGQATPYELDADAIEFTGGERVVAVRPSITVGSEGPNLLSIARFLASADSLSATEERLRLDGAVQLDTRTAAGTPWRVTAGTVDVEGGVDSAAAGPELERLRASGGVVIELGLRDRPLDEKIVARATAGSITGSNTAGTIRLEGFPDGRPALVTTPALVTEAQWIEVDPEIQLIRNSGPGRMLPASESVPGEPDWELSYSAASSFEDHETDSYVFALDQPYFESQFMNGILRGTVALFWFDRIGWQDLPTRVEESRGNELRDDVLRSNDYSKFVPIARLLEILRGRNLDGVLKEVVFEGPVEILRGDTLVAHAELIYVDCAGAYASMFRPQLNIFGEDVGEDFEKLIIRAEWVRQDEEGVLQANEATVTTSPFADPNLVVETGDLRVVPNVDGENEAIHQVYLRENRIHFKRQGFSLPLPPIGFGTDEEFKPLWPTARFANSARFGTLVTLGFRRPLPEKIGDTVHDALGGDEDDPYDASFSADASWLSGRGALFDLGVDIEAADDYKAETIFGIVPDSGDDEGYIRVPEDDRDNPRLWFRGHSRFEQSQNEWIDIEPSLQSDASVQSEFWEDEFERYERDESYVQWRKGNGESYYQATAKLRTDSFRSTVEELPSLSAHFGRRPLFDLGIGNVVWDGMADASYLRRRAGESGVQSPFSDTPFLGPDDAFADGFGDRETLRFDTRHRIEVPLELGAPAVRATPFVDGRFTVWDEGQNPESSPTRLLAYAGVRLATQLWRANSNGTLHQLVPFLEYANAVVEERVGDPVPFDGVEAPLGGDRLDLGLRGRFNVADGRSLFDVELRAQHLTDPQAGVEDGWQPLSVFARVDAEPYGLPLQFWHDGRFDLDDDLTRYALTAMGYRITEDLAIEVGHRTGRDLTDDRLFEAAVISALYRWTEKWEFEGRQVYSLLRDNGLDAGLILRRYGTDLVFELEFEVREGEGSSVGISFRPRFGFRPSRIGQIGW